MTSDYFDGLDVMLRRDGQARPCLVLDRDRLDHNIALARAQARLPVRVVAKSLACLPLLDRACAGLEAQGVMTFSAAMLDTLLTRRPMWSHLMGKPLPARAVAQVLDAHPGASAQVIWLVDSDDRGRQLSALADARGITLRVALEVDAGLHRGGFAPADMQPATDSLHLLPGLSVAGVMAYEPHLAKLPALFRPAARRRVRDVLRRAEGMGVVNTGGSMTFAAYRPADGASEVALGSVLVKPGDFDLRATRAFLPAMFIAAPVLKYLPGNPMPGPAWLSRLTGRGRRADIAIYGGYWKGAPVHPPGYAVSRVFGHSSNQEIWSGPPLDATPVDRFAFLRPSQSEAVLPEFAEVIVIAGGRVEARWPCLPAAQ